nr:hypothetical protein [Tanacetum cinerariifolium]
MVKTNSTSENEACCLKSCKKNIDNLNSKITDLTDKHFDAKNMIDHYKLGLAQFESRLDTVLFLLLLLKSTLLPRRICHGLASRSLLIDTVTDYSRPSPTIESTSGVKMGRSSPKNNYTHMSMPPRLAINRPYRPPMRPTRPNMNATRPNRTTFYKPAHSYTKRPFQETTQDLMIILIQKVKRLKRELTARTPIQKVNKGRSRCSIKFRGGLLGIKCSKIFPLSVMSFHCQKKFPLLEEVPPVSEESSPYLQRLNSAESLLFHKEGVDGKLAGFLTALKDLDNLIESQRSDKNKEGLGYSAVPPLLAQIYSFPKKDLSWTGLPKFVDDTVTNYSRPSPTIESTSGDDQNKNPSVTKTEASPSTISSKPFIKFVKAAKRSTTNKVETIKKPSVKFAELYQKTTKRSTVRGVKIGRSSPKNNYTHMSMPPRSAINKPYRPPMRPMRPNMSVAWPNRTSFYKPAHSYTKRPFQETTQDLMIISILKEVRNRACFNCGHFDYLSYDCGLGVKIGRSSPKNNYTHMSMPPRSAINRPYRPPMRPNMSAARPNITSFYKPAHSYTKRPFQETTQDLMIISILKVKRLERELKERTPIQKVDRGRSRKWILKKQTKTGKKRQNQTQSGKDQKRQSQPKPEVKSPSLWSKVNPRNVKVNLGKVKVSLDKTEAEK